MGTTNLQNHHHHLFSRPKLLFFYVCFVSSAPVCACIQQKVVGLVEGHRKRAASKGGLVTRNVQGRFEGW